jgi:hypothetical protein
MMDDTVFEQVMNKGKERKEYQKQSKEKREESIENGDKRLTVDRTPSGLYFVVQKTGGQLPEMLKGKFTSIDKIRKLVVARYGKDILE